jgi:osmotically-inducible protein OsmY
MKKTDMELQRDVIDELRWDPSVGTAEIGVAAKDGVVTLSGTVDSNAKKFGAIHATERVAGVKGIAEDLIVKLPTSFVRTDTEIAHAAVNAFKWNVEVPDDRVKVRVDDGWVVLEGDVDWQYQRKAAEDCVRYLTGVKGISNTITIKTRAFAPDVRRRIQDALLRSAEVDSKRISVETSDGKVTLRGTVRTWTERQDAERAAWSAPGVSAVEDQIAISVPVATR